MNDGHRRQLFTKLTTDPEYVRIARDVARMAEEVRIIVRETADKEEVVWQSTRQIVFARLGAIQELYPDVSFAVYLTDTTYEEDARSAADMCERFGEYAQTIIITYLRASGHYKANHEDG